ncbi:carboxypeptidase-like regulatory domain-containing protein [Flavobacterium sp. 102]|uniref:carboxypeptidase-like regulatory domain-containing protein n=1 Tax=Flavobacterium sp. 102 TaxID=2135623 RepID=UPI000EB14D70|nr:carboxypeptidase-like regulatory domain-containing protein [Flavobacterium sp. 102]RKS02924.1 carboxypeptidase family protein [Flavobacterium sp. 102]
MNQLQERKRSMYYVVEDFLATVPAAIIASMPEFEAKLVTFTKSVADIRQLSESQTTNRVGYRIVKDDLKLALTRKAIDVATRIKAYAINIDDVVLREEMYQRISNLIKKPDTICADICQYIHGKGSSLLANLSDYGVDNVMLDSLDDSISEYTSYIPKPRAGIVERKQATSEMSQLFASCDVVLKKMDALVNMLQFSDLEFYSTYYSSRKIIRPGYRTIAIRGIVTDAEGYPLNKVDVAIEDTAFSRKTTNNGGFEIKDIDSGMYTVIVKKPGYADTRTIVAVTATERTDVSIVMESVNSNAQEVA